MKPYGSVDVLYCDNHLLVAVKPSGLLTQPDSFSQESLETACKEWVKETFHKKGAVFLHCIHRLDKPVSGLVLFARTSKALSRLNEQSRLMEIQRIYCAEVEGMLAKPEAVLDHYLIHGDHRALVASAEDPRAKHARLTYQVVRKLEHSTCLAISLETGRYHQIRAQLSAAGHPIVGDVRYGSTTDAGGAVRLHCQKLSFRHPVTKEIVSFESPPPF